MTVHNNYETPGDDLRAVPGALIRYLSSPVTYVEHLIEDHGYTIDELPRYGNDYPRGPEHYMDVLDTFHANARRAPAPDITTGARQVPPGEVTFDGPARDPHSTARAALKCAHAFLFPAIFIGLHLRNLSARRGSRAQSAVGAVFSASVIAAAVLDFLAFSKARRG